MNIRMRLQIYTYLGGYSGHIKCRLNYKAEPEYANEIIYTFWPGNAWNPPEIDEARDQDTWDTLVIVLSL